MSTLNLCFFLKGIGGLLEGGPRLRLDFKKEIGRPEKRSRGVGGRPAGGGDGGEGRGWLAAELAKKRDPWLAPPELTER